MLCNFQSPASPRILAKISQHKLKQIYSSSDMCFASRGILCRKAKIAQEHSTVSLFVPSLPHAEVWRLADFMPSEEFPLSGTWSV